MKSPSSFISSTIYKRRNSILLVPFSPSIQNRITPVKKESTFKMTRSADFLEPKLILQFFLRNLKKTFFGIFRTFIWLTHDHETSSTLKKCVLNNIINFAPETQSPWRTGYCVRLRIWGPVDRFRAYAAFDFFAYYQTWALYTWLHCMGQPAVRLRIWGSVDRFQAYATWFIQRKLFSGFSGLILLTHAHEMSSTLKKCVFDQYC